MVLKMISGHGYLLSVIPAVGGMRQEDLKFKASKVSLDYIARSCYKQNQTNHKGVGAGEVVPSSRAFTALSEDAGSVPSTHFWPYSCLEL